MITTNKKLLFTFVTAILTGAVACYFFLATIGSRAPRNGSATNKENKVDKSTTDTQIDKQEKKTEPDIIMKRFLH
jgi:hypothetical protein